MLPAAFGLEAKTVRLVPYDLRWPALYEAEAERIRAALGEHLLAIEHVGSTAVPGLMAKPILDIQVAVASFVVGGPLINALESIGYQHRPEDPIPGRLYFSLSREGLRTHQIHLCEAGGRNWRDRLRFRDLLRADAQLATAYVALKRDLAARHANDRLAYATGKDQFIATALALAR